MNSINIWTTFRPFDAFALTTRLTSRLEARRQGKRFALNIHQLRELDPHILRDIGVNRKALFEPKPKIIDLDGRTLLS